ncbi:scavenger receptor class B member 1-like [Ischnura elegans]|uniref:scavenger receptor class B member 1-like n=1 Tax=Ischnura elegans TaxID=197161 RepID=UPI001ED89F93|nr:scavenger receptor class B member 1-like [Ischnura elegans]
MRYNDELLMEGRHNGTPIILDGSLNEKKQESQKEKELGDKEEAAEGSAESVCCCRRNCPKILIATLMSASFVSLILALVIHTGNFVDFVIQKNLVIKNGSQHYEWWKNPPVGTLVKITLFNYTNYEAFMKKQDKKLKLQEVGPLVYRVQVRKVNVTFPAEREGEIVTFQVNRSYEFVPELSPGVREDDLIVTPNFNLLALASGIHDSPYALKIALMGVLNIVKVDPFRRLTAAELLWGYDDPIFDQAKKFVTFKRGSVPMKKFGLMAGETGLSSDLISIHTGKSDPSVLGVISAYNGKPSLLYWGGEECNRVDGSEGSIFPHTPATTRYDPNAKLQTHVFNYFLCRRYPFEQQGVVETPGEIPAIRFAPPKGVYDSPLEQPDHRCFCDPERSYCPPSGVFNVSPCAYGAPVMISFPHFHGGHHSLVEHFEGLNPEKKHHEFFLDVEPTLGVPLRAKSAFQMNAMVRPSWAIKELAPFPQNLILPLHWAQVTSDEIPDYLIRNIRFATQTSFLVEKLLICTLYIVSFVLLGIVYVKMKTSRKELKKTEPSTCGTKIITTEKGGDHKQEKV